MKLAYNPGKILPTTDSTYIKYTAFKQKFGEDGSLMVLGIQNNRLFQKDFFNEWFKLHQNIKKISGIKQVLSLANLVELKKDTVDKKFVLNPLVPKEITHQNELDSLKKELSNLPFYKDFLFNSAQNASIMAITFDQNTLQTANQIKAIKEIKKLSSNFEKQEKTTVHYSGLPYIKTVLSGLIAKEFSLFLGLSVLISAIILWLFFRSIYAVVFPVLFVLFGVVWTVALMALAGFEITLLTGIIPPIIVIIGIPNSILILNKYRTEFAKSEDQIVALSLTIQKIAITTFIANLTTAIGFGVLYFTQSNVLKEFGTTAAIGVMFTWAICLFMLPIILSFLPHPKIKTKTKHQANILAKFLLWVDHLVHQNRKTIYYSTALITLIALIGIAKININSFMVDDLPKNDPIYTDLKFFESTFNGVLPLEISVDAQKKNGIVNLSTINKIDRLEKLIASYPDFGKGISITNVLKYSSQAFYNGNPVFYRIPNDMEKNFILMYAANSGKKNNMMQSFLDKDRQVTRITFQMKDVGSKKMNTLLAELQPKINHIFNPNRYQVSFTGPIIMYVKGSNYLVKNLKESLLLAIFLIAIIMWILFRGFKMIVISLLPNLIPLLITAGIMGYFGIPIKPSTILIFSIALGIASDQTIYFLTSYQQEVKSSGHHISSVISKIIKETGFSMIYTAIILFLGFGIFAFSTFGGTVALGTLLAITLVLAMLFNLIFLPALLLSLEKSKPKNINLKDLS
ncbi:MMPL family transporter [Pelobium sp.]|nr:MMPL family transporter [Pelobium sp.]MDA9555569.1 MMPL family transporter [Pelobium sp.]